MVAIIELLKEIIELLNAIKENTTPAETPDDAE